MKYTRPPPVADSANTNGEKHGRREVPTRNLSLSRGYTDTTISLGASYDRPPFDIEYEDTIYTLPDERYYLKQSIAAQLRTHEGDWYARFDEANIEASGGDDLEEAKLLLADYICGTVSVLLKNEDSLGPFLAWQLSVLRDYIVEK